MKIKIRFLSKIMKFVTNLLKDEYEKKILENSSTLKDSKL